MKYIAKMMLAALASVALAVPAYAWDFKASGSLSSTFNQTTTKASADADAISSMDVGSEGGAITLSSSNSDGDKSSSFSYSVNYADAGLDQTLSVSGKAKVGKWTATGNVDYNIGWQADETIQGGEDAEEISVTDGTMTISLGDGSFLSSASTVTGGVAGGNVAMADDDASIGAYVGAPQRLSIGYKISDTMTGTFAYQTDSDAKIFDEIAEADGLTSYQTSAFGINVNADVGANVGFTFASGSTAPKSSAQTGGTSASTMGLGVKLAMGDMTPFFSYGTISVSTSESKIAYSETGMGLGLTMGLGGGDSFVFSYTTDAQKTEVDGTETGNASATGLELGYNTKVGPVSLGAGYGSKSVAADTGTWGDDGTARADGYNATDIEVKMAFSF